MQQSTLRRWMTSLKTEVLEALMEVYGGEPDLDRLLDEELDWDPEALGIDSERRDALKEAVTELERRVASADKVLAFFGAPSVDERYLRFMEDERDELEGAEVEGLTWSFLPQSQPVDQRYHAVAALGDGELRIAIDPQDASAPVLLVDEHGHRALASTLDHLLEQVRKQ